METVDVSCFVSMATALILLNQVSLGAEHRNDINYYLLISLTGTAGSCNDCEAYFEGYKDLGKC